MPGMQRDVAALVQRAYANSEFVSAGGAMIPTRSHGLAHEWLNRVKLAAERTKDDR